MIKQIDHKKNKATWLGSRTRIIKQIVVSMLSFITLPFARHNDKAIGEYFKKVYYKKPDPLIFDGNELAYYNIIDLVVMSSEFSLKNIIDIGCGKGSFYKWLKSSSKNFSSYLGIDIALRDTQLTENAKIVNCDVLSYSEKLPHNNFVVLINSLCYFSEDRMLNVFTNKDICSLLLIEPVPSLFWDAHFSNIKLFYRNPVFVKDLLVDYGFEIIDMAVDYGIKNNHVCLCPLSYCIYAIRRC